MLPTFPHARPLARRRLLPVLVALALLAPGAPALAAGGRVFGPPADSAAASYWGPLPARSDSVTGIFAKTPTPTWEKVVEAPYVVAVFPLKLAADGMGHTLVFVDRYDIVPKVTNLLHPRFGPFRASLGVWAGDLDGITALVSAKADPLGGEGRRMKLGVRYSTTASSKVVAGYEAAAAGGTFDLGAGYRNRPNARYFGLGSASREADESFFKMEVTWAGASWRRPLAGRWDAEVGALHSMEGALAPPEETPSVAARFGPLAPAGVGDRSDGVTASAGLIHDTTAEDGRPDHGGLRTFRVSRFAPTDGSDAAFWTWRLDAQQFFPLWLTERSLALRALVSRQIAAGEDPIPFSRMLTNETPDDFRGYRTNRWRDTGLLLFTAEYRWPVWCSVDHRSAGLDAYLFTDAGQVFGRTSEIAAADLAKGYGFGFRLIGGEGYAMRAEIAKSAEEWVVRLSGDQVFQYAKAGLYHGRQPTPVR